MIRNGCKMGATLKREKKKSPVNHRFTGLFLRRFRMMGLNQRQPIKKGEIYSRFFSSLPAPVPLYLLRVVLKLYESDTPMFCV